MFNNKITTPEQPPAPPTYIFLMAEYVATLECMVHHYRRFLPPYVVNDMVARMDALKQIEAHHISPWQISKGLPVTPKKPQEQL